MKRTHIVAAVILNPEKNRIFITKRSEHAHQGGLWEFPGGKVDGDETAEQAISRELFEEVGIKVEALQHLTYLEHDYLDKRLKFDFFIVTDFEHEPYGKEGQEGKWIEIIELTDHEFPKANIPIIQKVIEIYA